MVNSLLTTLAQITINNGEIKDLPRNPITDSSISSVLSVVFGVIGAVAVIAVILGGLQYVLSQGNPQTTTKAKDTILYALVGVVVAISGYAIVNFVLDGIL